MIYEGDDGAIVVKFGHGTVGVLTGYLLDCPEIQAIELMKSNIAYPIGDYMLSPEVFNRYIKNRCTSDELGYEGFCPGVRLLFDKIESIDVLIDALYIIRERITIKFTAKEKPRSQYHPGDDGEVD